MPWVTIEGRTCDDIRDVLRLPREPSGDNKRTTRTGMYQWTTLYCAEIALALVTGLNLRKRIRFKFFQSAIYADRYFRTIANVKYKFYAIAF